MKKLVLLIILFLAFLILHSFSFAQNKKIDSLKILIKKNKADTNNVHHLNKLCEEYKKTGLYDTALICGNNALQLAQQLNFKKGIVDSYSNIGLVFFYQDDYSKTLECFLKALRIAEDLKDINSTTKIQGNIGVIYMQQGNYSKALESYFTALKTFEELGDKEGVASNLGNIGFAYWSQGDFPKALEYYFNALKIAESIGNKGMAANNLSNIGLAYWRQASYPKAIDYYLMALRIDEELEDKNSQMLDLGNIGLVYSDQNDLKALEYYSKALKIAEELGSKYGMALNSGNIGGVYHKVRDYPKALNYYLKGLKLFEELGIKSGMATNLMNIGLVYQKLHDYPKALDYHFKALKITEELGDKSEIARNMSNIGSLYTETGKYTQAEQFLKKAIAIDDSVGALNELREAELNLSQLYDTTGRHREALIHYKKAVAIKDTIFSQENKKELVRKEMNYEFDKKEAATKAANEKLQAIAEEKNRKQKIITWSIASGLLLVALFAGFIFRTLRITRKQKQIIELKNTETEQQKIIIEEKNKDITDSIRYAKRIQDALMGEKVHVSLHLPEHFILFLPKDIVSGDFHWGVEKHGYWYFAAVDCTGHGVPGAVMSMLGISFLNDIVSSEKLLSPAEVLNRLRDKVIKELRQTGEEGGSKDGMDISLCRLNLKTKELQWAGAYNPLNLFRNGQLEELKADKQPIGYHTQSRPFTNHEIQLQKGDSIYISTDGYADQFGGPNGKKFKYKQLENLIIANNHLPLKDQKEILKKRFMEWKGSLEQVDDVCVFGVKV